MGKQHPFHLQAGDILAAADDDVLLAIDDLNVAVRVDGGQITGPQPVPGRRLRLRLSPIALHDTISPDRDLPQIAAVPGRERPCWSSSASSTPGMG